MKKSEDSLRDVWGTIKQTNIHIMGVPGGEEREKVAEKLLEEITAQNVSNLGKETDIQIQEAQRVPKQMNSKRPTP